MHLQLAIDTHDRASGQMILPISGLRSGAGFEFMARFNAPDDAELMVEPEYNPYMPYRLTAGGAFFGEHFRRPVHSVARLDGVFDSLWVLTNRPRFLSRDVMVAGQGVNTGRLRYGTVQESSLSDWWYDQASGTVEIRIPWLLLNVTDPSSHMVLSESAPDLIMHPRDDLPPSKLIGIPTDGFDFAVVGITPRPELLGTIPKLDAYGNWPRAAFKTWLWPGWDVPAYHTYKKAAYYAMQKAWADR
jgi:hypothetical protein